jgi:hypothetical protein
MLVGGFGLGGGLGLGGLLGLAVALVGLGSGLLAKSKEMHARDRYSHVLREEPRV